MTFTSGEESNDEEEPVTKKPKEADKAKEVVESVEDKGEKEASEAESASTKKVRCCEIVDNGCPILPSYANTLIVILQKEKSSKQKEKSETTPPVQYDSIDLMSYESVEQLCELPMEHLKQELQRRGLKVSNSNGFSVLLTCYCSVAALYKSARSVFGLCAV